MIEVILEGLSARVKEGTIQTWFCEEGDPLNEGDDLVQLSSEEGSVTIQAPKAGILAEVYYDEGELVAKGEVLCTIDDEDAEEEEEEEAERSDEEEK